MIRTATSVLNDLVTAMPVGKRHGLVEVLDGVPSAHAGNGQFVPVINDSDGGVSYWRSDGAASIADISAATGCANAVRVSMPMALIGFVRRDQCDDMEAVLQAAVIQLRAALKPLRNSIAGVFSTGIGSVSMGVDVVRTSEIKDFAVPTSLAVLSMRFTLTVDGSDDCLADACQPGDPICALIQGLRWSRIEGCLTPRQTEQAIESLCSGGGPCDLCDVVAPANPQDVVDCVTAGNVPALVAAAILRPEATPEVIVVAMDGADKTDEVRALICTPCPPTTVNGTESDTPTITVVQDDVEVGVLDPVTGIHTVPPCPPFVCDPLTVNINGSPMAPVDDPCGSVLNLDVVDGDGNPVGSGDTSTWFIGNGRIRTTDGSLLVHETVAEEVFDLPEIQVPYDDGSLIQLAGPYDTSYDGTTYLQVGAAIPWRPQRNSAGTIVVPTIHLGDLIADTIPDAPDGTVNDTGGAPIGPVVSGGFINLPESAIKYKDAANVSQVLTASDTEYTAPYLNPLTEVPRITIYAADGSTVLGYAGIGSPSFNVPNRNKWGWAPGNADTIVWTVTADEAGTFTTFTNDGGSGTLTYSKNGGAFVAVSGSITLAIADTIVVRRTITTNTGWSKWAA